jgi:sortase A
MTTTVATATVTPARTTSTGSFVGAHVIDERADTYYAMSLTVEKGTDQARNRAPDRALAATVGSLRSRRWARRALSGLSLALLLTAVGLLGYPFYTNLYQGRVQSRLDRQIASPELDQRYRANSLKVGDALTRIKIPKIGVDVVVVEGTSASALRAGAGHYPQTPLALRGGQSGDRRATTYGRPFSQLDRLRPGDEVILETPVGRCVYELQRAPFVTTPTDLSVLNPTPAATLTLTTCHPKGSARQRLIVKAVMTKASSHEA